MGSSPSQSTQTEYTRDQPIRSNYHSSRPQTRSPRSYPQSVPTQRNRLRQDELEWAQPVQRQQHAHNEFTWPLPSDGDYTLFQVNDNSDSDRYTLASPLPRVSCSFVPLILCSKFATLNACRVHLVLR